MNKRLYRTQDDSMFAGVAGGLGKYMNIDPTLVRLFFVFSTFFTGFGIVLYLAMWLVVPYEDEIVYEEEEEEEFESAEEV